MKREEQVTAWDIRFKSLGNKTSGEPFMSSDRPKRETVCFEETNVSNIWEIAAMVQGLEKTG